ncbi:MAG: pyruvate kinase [Candidatus Auribacterota bacterium]
MAFQENKTKIICTIGPASESQEIMEMMIRAGMNIARLNFSHGDFETHKTIIERIRAASKAVGQRVAIMADLPGPKMRIGSFSEEPVRLDEGETFILTTDDVQGNAKKVSISFEKLPHVVKPDDTLFLNDGFIQLKVLKSDGHDVHCKVVVGGELRSKKGLNMPGIDLGISAFTDQDRECLKFAAEMGIDAVSQSFVETADDIKAVRAAATALGYTPFIIAKIERAGALKNLDKILQAADGIMVARGDLGVEIPIEEIAITQKEIIEKAMFRGKPVITATQMLESMTTQRRPTRAEATDVANAILDGTDCVMLSAESAMGKHPVCSVRMLVSIAKATEPRRTRYRMEEALKTYGRDGNISMTDLIALSVETTLLRIKPATILVPTLTGATARNIARFRPDVWITAVSPNKATCQNLQFSYGVYPVYDTEYHWEWKSCAKQLFKDLNITNNLVVLVEGPSSIHPDANHRMELIDLRDRE